MINPVYGYGLVGNCQVAALISDRGSIDWFCAPRMHSAPIFGAILDRNAGCFGVELLGFASSAQKYRDNTNILETILTDADGNALKITDFCPRFMQYQRSYRPPMICRTVEPIAGMPRIRMNVDVIDGWSKQRVQPAVAGDGGLVYSTSDGPVFLSMSVSRTYLQGTQDFALTEKVYFVLNHGQALEQSLDECVESMLRSTDAYWRTWVKHCSVPTEYQKQVIRSALTLKLNCFEDTGAIIAAPTTSLPETLGEERNWDYRFCWLRDAYFTLTAFHALGHFEEMEGFLKFLRNIVERSGPLMPVYSLDGKLPIPESAHWHWDGYRGSRPVRSNNQAGEHVQNDVYGEVMLSLSPIFHDERFIDLRDQSLFDLVDYLAERCEESISKPDAGPWELRDKWQEHSFTNLLCWAGLDRAARVGRRFRLKRDDYAQAADRARHAFEKSIRDSVVGNGPTDATLDASLLMMASLGYPDARVSLATARAIADRLRVTDNPADRFFLYRYRRADDFGTPSSSFLICGFWLVESLARLGQTAEARVLLEQSLRAQNSLGLFSEHFDPRTDTQLGNFPQAYSHVGFILSAFGVSPPWNQIL